MSHHILDTSALVKHYHKEPGSSEVDQLWANAGARLSISRLSVVETVSTLAKKVRQGNLTSAAFALMRQRFASDVRRRRPGILRMLVRHFQEADRLLRQHSLSHNLNTLDALQLAVAIDHHRKVRLDEFVASDRVLLTVAQLEGLRVFDPVNPIPPP